MPFLIRLALSIVGIILNFPSRKCERGIGTGALHRFDLPHDTGTFCERLQPLALSKCGSLGFNQLQYAGCGLTPCSGPNTPQKALVVLSPSWPRAPSWSKLPPGQLVRFFLDGCLECAIRHHLVDVQPDAVINGQISGLHHGSTGDDYFILWLATPAVSTHKFQHNHCRCVVVASVFCNTSDCTK